MKRKPGEGARVAASPLHGLAHHSYLFERAPYTIRDAIYGSVPLSAAAYATLDTRAFQRLKHLRQVGPVYLVYPGATHSRFSHCIGVYHLVRLALQHLSALADIEPDVGRATLAAALLHDLGHFPNSHVLDDLCIDGSRLSHVELSIALIESDPEVRQVLQEAWEVDPALVTAILAGRPHPHIPRFVYTLIDGPMDMDKLDYLNRDAHHSGVPYGRVEVQRLIDFLDVDDHTGELVVTDAGVGTVESVIFAKYLMFRYVYWHHTARIAGAMFNRAVLDCLLALGIRELSVKHPAIRELCLSTDSTVEQTLRRLLAEAGAQPPASLALLDRVEGRRLYKRALAVPCERAPDEDEALAGSLVRRAREQALAAAAAGGGSFHDFAVLIDVPPRAKFAADVRGILLEDEYHGRRTVPWEDAPQRSYLSAATVAGMEQSIRSILYLYDAEAADAAALKEAILKHAQEGESRTHLTSTPPSGQPPLRAG